MINDTIINYNFPEADSLKDEIKLIALEENFHYTTQKAHRHNYFELFYFIKGGGTHLIDFNHHPIKDLSLHMVKPGALHLVKRTPSSSGFVLLFTKSFLYSLVDFTPATHMQLWQQKSVYPLSAAENIFVSQSLIQIQDEIQSNRPQQMKVLASLLHMIFILMYRQAPEVIPVKNNLTEAFLNLLETQYTSHWSASEYAKQLNCSLKTLNEALKKAQYPTATKNIKERKILEAKRLLIHTNWSIKEIAYHLNFEDPDYFGKVFKAHTNLSASAFKDKNS